MDIRVNKASDVPVHEQIAAQIAFSIGTGGLQPGAELPSVRALALRLRVHRNTIVRAYQDLTLNLLVEKAAGRRLMVSRPEVNRLQDVLDLDDLLTVTIVEAQRLGYSLPQLHERLLGRILAEPPTRVLVVSDDAGMRLLLARELTEQIGCRAEACGVDELRSRPERSLGALVLSPLEHVRQLRGILRANHPIVTLTYAAAHEHLHAIGLLASSSLILLVSVSAFFLERARGILAPAVGRRHSVRTHLLTGKQIGSLGAADLILCDRLAYSVVRPRYKAANVLIYRPIAEACLKKIKGGLGVRV